MVKRNGENNNEMYGAMGIIQRAEAERKTTEKDVGIREKYNFLNKEELKERSLEVFQEAIYKKGEQKSYENIATDLRSCGKIFIDVNGLKAINDFASHADGDIFIDRLSHTLKNNEEIKKFIKDNNLEVEIAHEGGDEFGFLVKKIDGELYEEGENSPIILLNLKKIIQDEVKKIKVDDLLDFESPSVLKKLNKNDLEILEKAKKEEGGTYKYNISAAVGACALDQALNSYLEILTTLREKGIEPTKREKILDGLKGLTRDLAEFQMKKDKAEMKNKLSEGSWQEKFNVYLMMRTEESRELFRENIWLKEQIYEKNEIIEDLSERIVKKETENVELREKVLELEKKLADLQKNNYFDFEEKEKKD